MRIAVSVVCLVLLAAAGCGADDVDEAPRSALAERLAALCEETRAEVEALGEPKDEGAAVFRPWAAAGARFVARVRRVQAPTPAQQRRLETLADYYGGFYDSLRKSHQLHLSGESVGIKQTLERAYALLASGEQLAVRLGAPECAVRPFEAES